MLRHIYKNQMIQFLRYTGYSKKKAKQIYDRFEAAMIAQNRYLCHVKYSRHHQSRSYRLSGAFTWAETKQGPAYWAKIHNKAFQWEHCRG